MISSIELHQLFDFEIDKEHTQDAPSFHPLTKDKFINLAIDRYVKSRYIKTDYTEKDREDIAMFLVQQSFVPTIISENLLEFDLDNLNPKHWYTIKMLIKNDKECENEYIEIVPEKHDNVFKRLDNPFKRPKPNKCFYTLQKQKLLQIYKHKNTDISEIVIWYIKQFIPCNILTNAITDITEQIKQDVIEIAVAYAKQYIVQNGENNRQQ